MGRNSGKGDLRIPRGWERAGDPIRYKNGWLQAYREKNPLDAYCDRCQHSQAWCECDKKPRKEKA